MLKRALKSAIGPSVGVTVGSVIFRITNQGLYNETWPSVLEQTVLYLFAGYIVCFVVSLLIEFVRQKSGNSQ